MNYEKDFQKFSQSLGVSSMKLDYYKNRVESSTTPYILEEREMRVTQMDVFSRLMRDRIIWLTKTVNDDMSSIVQAQLMYLDNVENKDITLHVDTPGGSVKSGLSIIDVMNYVKSDINTINTGMAASMGSVLLSSGTKGKRSSLLNSKVMIHQVSHGSQGHVEDTRINQIQAEKYNFILFKMLGENTNKDYKEVIEVSKRDKWFTSQEALEFGLIDEVIGGKNMNHLLEGFEDYYKRDI